MANRGDVVGEGGWPAGQGRPQEGKGGIGKEEAVEGTNVMKGGEMRYVVSVGTRMVREGM